MKIGVMSDSHDQIEHIQKAMEIFNQQKVEFVVHCGDWVAPFTLRFYETLKCSIKGVFGNNDGDKFRMLLYKERFDIDLQLEERFMKLDVDGRKIAVFHGDYKEIVDALVTCGSYDAVFHGHTHKRINETVGQTLSLNPGSLVAFTRPGIEGRSIAIYDTGSNSAEHIMIQ